MDQFNLPIFETRGVLAKAAIGFEGIEAPRAVPSSYIKKCKTYREVCRMAWQMRRVRNMTYTMFAAYGGFTRQHVGDWFNKDDKPTRRSMPAECIADSEAILGVTIITQWLADKAKLTVLEEMQIDRAFA